MEQLDVDMSPPAFLRQDVHDLARPSVTFFDLVALKFDL